MSSEVSPRRSVLSVILSTIGVIFLVFFIALGSLVVFVVHSFSASMQAANHAANSKLNYSIPTHMGSYVAGIRLSGEISDDTANEIVDKLETAREDSAAVGILLEVNSPGGSVVPSQEIYDEVKKVAASKPVVVYVREMAASGAYYSSASATKIVANRGSMVGSIGVIMEGYDAQKLMEFLKVTPNTVKTGELKDTGSPTRAMTDKDRKYLQTLIEATRQEFASDVKQGRGTSDDTMNYMSDGRVVLAPEALKLKLIDKVGSKDDALSEIAFSAKIKKAPELFYYENIESLSDLFAQKLSSKVSPMFEQAFGSVLHGASLKAE
jgi:protease-4